MLAALLKPFSRAPRKSPSADPPTDLDDPVPVVRRAAPAPPPARRPDPEPMVPAPGADKTLFPVAMKSGGGRSPWPISRPMYKLWEDSRGAKWGHKQAPAGDDAVDWADPTKVGPELRRYIERIMGYFVTAETAIAKSVGELARYLDAAWPQFYLSQQASEEALHGVSLQIYIDRVGVDRLQAREAFLTVPTTAAKDEFVKRHTAALSNRRLNLDDPVDVRTLARAMFVQYACMEGLLFYTTFAAIKTLCGGSVLKGLNLLYGYIRKDEERHVQGGMLMLHGLRLQFPAAFTPEFDEELSGYLEEAIELEMSFCEEALPPGGLPGVSLGDCRNYLYAIAERRREQFGLPEFRDPSMIPKAFPGMASGIRSLASFFESHDTDYMDAGAARMDKSKLRL